MMKRYDASVLIPFGVFFLLSLFLLRDTLFSPGILTFDDMIPFHHFHQIGDFMFQSWNDYYQWPEVRGRYAFLWTPLRYAPWMPLGLLFACVMIGLGAYGLSAHLYQRFQPMENSLQKLAPILAGGLYLILIFSSKAQQLNTLFLGAAFYPMALHAYLKASGSEMKKFWMWALLAALLLVINPAIHLVVLGYGTLTFLMLVQLFSKDHRKAGVLGWLIITLAGLVPYSIWILGAAAAPTTAATASVPLTLIEAWSAPFQERLLLPVGLSLTETQATGIYTFVGDLFERYPLGSWLFAIYSAASGLSLIFWRKSLMAWGFGLLWLLTVFMSTGLYYNISGYQVLISLAQSDGILSTIAGAVLTILRNPDRWLFPASLCLVVLSGALFYGLFRWLKETNWEIKAGGGLLGVAIFAIPLVMHPAFQSTFSGNLGGLLKPAPMPVAYREALDIIDAEKTLYLPLMGTRQLRWNHNKKTQDEPFALMHGGASIEGATGSTLINQSYVGYLYFELLYQQKTTQLGQYLNLNGIRYVLFHDDVLDPFVEDEFETVLTTLKAQQDLELVYERDQVYLFENQSNPAPVSLNPLNGLILSYGGMDDVAALIESGVDPLKTGLLQLQEGDLDWDTFAYLVQNHPSDISLYAPQGHEDLFLLLLASKTGHLISPTPGWDAASEDWETHRELNIHVNNFNKFKGKFGYFGVEQALHHRLIATDVEGAVFPFEFEITTPGQYQLYLRVSAPAGSRLQLSIADHNYEQDVLLSGTQRYHFVPVDTLHLNKDKYRLQLENLTNFPVVVNALYLVPVQNVDTYRALFESHLSALNVANTTQALAESIQASAPSGEWIGYYERSFWNQHRLLKDGRYHMPLRSWMVANFYLATLEKPSNFSMLESDR